MSNKRGRPATFSRQTRKYFARLIERYGVREACEVSKISVSPPTLKHIAKEFGIRLQAGRRPADASHVPKPKLSELQIAQLEQILACGPVAAGYRSGEWTCRRITDVVRKSLGVKCHPVHLNNVLNKLGFQVVERRVFVLIRTGKSVAKTPVDDSVSDTSRRSKAA